MTGCSSALTVSIKSSAPARSRRGQTSGPTGRQCRTGHHWPAQFSIARTAVLLAGFIEVIDQHQPELALTPGGAKTGLFAAVLLRALYVWRLILSPLAHPGIRANRAKSRVTRPVWRLLTTTGDQTLGGTRQGSLRADRHRAFPLPIGRAGLG